MQTWTKNEHFFVIIIMLFCSQLHWEKGKGYLLFETTVVYFSIVWLRMYEVIESCPLWLGYCLFGPLLKHLYRPYAHVCSGI